MISRRKLLGGAVGGAVAAGIASAGQTVRAGYAALGSGGMGNAISAVGFAGAPQSLGPVEAALHAQMRSAEAKRQKRARYRIGPFDGDIFANQSWSPAFMRIVQERREKETRSIFETLHKKLGWG